MTTTLISSYSVTEERINAITHGVGFVGAFLGFVYLMFKADTPVASISVAIYGCSLMLMFFTSTAYHSASNQSIKSILKLIDHSAIYLLIAGTYTPFMLVALDNWMGVTGAVVIWTIALLGLAFKWIAANRFPRVSVALYLLMGWLIVLFIYPLYQVVPGNGLWLLLAGGIFFSVGVAFYVKKHIPYTHAIWHCFVIAGCVCHFFAIYYFVI